MYPGIDGFLNTRASVMLDVVFLAMFVVLPVLAWSIWLVKVRRNYALHKRVQLALGLVLLVAVTLFEVDMQFITQWELRAKPSPYFATWVYPSLYVHLAFAIPTALLWVYVIVQALRRFPQPPAPGEHSRQHIRWAWIAAIEMTMTALTGWAFYWLAFVA
ncbi:MAG: DUF420 domain-containing protein [Pirellulales bacterium]